VTPTRNGGVRNEHPAIWTGSEMIVWGGYEPQLSSVVNTGARYNPQTDSWAPVTPTRNGGVRNEHPAVWTGTEMIVWGSYEEFTIPTNTGARYTPATDTWAPTSMVGVPVDRYAPIAVWTGTEMVVWGGCDDPFCFTRLNSGGRYTPQSDTWRPTSMAGAPVGRYWFSAAWTGSQVLVWGGCDSQTCGPGGNADPDGTNTGGRYDPVADTWQSLPVTAATPAPRWGAAAAWTGSQLLVWGGLDGHSGALGTGGRYDLATNQWLPVSNAQAPVARSSHRMVWTGSEAIVWGGTGNDDDTYDIVTGGRYTPATDSWQPTSTANVPQGRAGHSAVWTGREMIVWGGCRDLNCQTPLRTGGRYNPVTDSWVATSTLEAPSARDSHSAVWTGTEMIVFGGEWGARNPTVFDTGGRYCLAAPSYDLSVSPTALQAAPGENAPASVTVSSVNNFSGAVSLTTSGLPAGATAVFANAVVTPQANGTASTGMTVSVGPNVPPGHYLFQVTSSSGSLVRSQAVDLSVAAPDGAGSVGLYNPTEGAFFLRNAPSSGPADFAFSYGPGGAGWRAITGDWNGDGDDTVGLYDPYEDVIFLKNRSSN
jgi:N-acetylneuraminic acid mutarotase